VCAPWRFPSWSADKSDACTQKRFENLGQAYVAGHPDPFGADLGVDDDDDVAPWVPLPESGFELPPAEPDMPGPTWAYEESVDADPRVRSTSGMHVHMMLQAAASVRCLASHFLCSSCSHVQVRGGDSGSSDGDGEGDGADGAVGDDMDNDAALILVAQYVQQVEHGQMAAQQAEHDGDAPMPLIVHVPDAPQPGGVNVEPQQPPTPTTLAWCLHHFDDVVFAGAVRTTVRAAYKALQLKVAGKMHESAKTFMWAPVRWLHIGSRYQSPESTLKEDLVHITQTPQNIRYYMNNFAIIGRG
jgi:hypothetical protein